MTSEERLSGAVAHRLRNSLTAIRLQIELARMDPPGAGEALDQLSVLVEKLDDTICALADPADLDG
jgi:hypothetical protein